MGADLTGSDISALTFWDSRKQGGGETAVSYMQGQVYSFPGGIKSIQLAAGNIKLFRASTLRPGGKNAQ